MGEGDWDTPERPIFSMSWQNFPEPPGLLTPPLHPGAVVPFQWEEVPGRPRPWLAQSPVVTEGMKRCLNLPPRLLGDRQGPTTTVTNSITILSLKGPYPWHRKRPTKTWSFGWLGSTEKMAFGSSRWAGFCSGEPSHDCKKILTPGGHDRGCVSGTSPSEFYCCDCDRDREETNGDMKVKITRVKRRRRSFLSPSPTKSHLWERIYEGIKQVVPWRCPSENKTRRRPNTLSQSA